MCLLPQRRPAGQGGRLRRRVLGRSSHPRAGCRLVPRGVPLLWLRLPVQSGAPGRARRDNRGGPTAVDRGDGHLSTAPTCISTARTAIPSRSSQLPPVLVGGGGEKVNLRIAARRADLTNWQVGLAHSNANRACWPSTARRSDGPSRRSPGPTDRTAGSSTPRRRPWPGANQKGAASWRWHPDRSLSGRQSGGHGRTGDREDPGLPRRRLPRAHPVAAGLSGRRDPATIHGRGGAGTEGSLGPPSLHACETVRRCLTTRVSPGSTTR